MIDRSEFKRLVTTLAVVTAAASSWAGCSSSDGGGSKDSQGCTPGDTNACACPGGVQGSQTCKSDGSGYGACDGCPAGSGGASSTGGSSSSGGGASTGGATASGGALGTGGATGSGGIASDASAGGSTGTGGAPATGGVAGTGGTGACAPADLCGGNCCTEGAACYTDQVTGDAFCVQVCMNSLECGPSSPCCTYLFGGATTLVYGCLPEAAGRECVCTSRSDCSGLSAPNNGACAPHTEGGVVTDTYRCVPNDATAGNGCHTGAGSCCASGTDCREDPNANRFCAPPGCTVDSDCGNPGVACCKPSSCQNCITSCSGGPGTCVPC